MTRIIGFTGSLIGFAGLVVLLVGLAPMAWAFGLWLSHALPWWLWVGIFLICIGLPIEKVGKR